MNRLMCPLVVLHHSSGRLQGAPTPVSVDHAQQGALRPESQQHLFITTRPNTTRSPGRSQRGGVRGRSQRVESEGGVIAGSHQEGPAHYCLPAALISLHRGIPRCPLVDPRDPKHPTHHFGLNAIPRATAQGPTWGASPGGGVG
ncbi:unnamed protein product [Lota lota]